jgi:hypothetical protein
MDALVNANRNGNSERALIFCGECVDRIHEILSVPDIFRNLLREAALA